MTTPADKKVRRAWKSWAIEIGLALALLFGVHLWQTRHTASGPAPALQGTLLDGRPFTLTFPRDKPVLVHFWATWCGVCTAEAGNVTALTDGHDVVTVVSQSGSEGDIARTMRDRGIAWPVTVNDRHASLTRTWGVQAFPTSFVIGRDGTIRHVEVGYTTTLGLKARMWLAGR
jgi:thiol-disulfide isomerase/thioredoxin